MHLPKTSTITMSTFHATSSLRNSGTNAMATAHTPMHRKQMIRRIMMERPPPNFSRIIWIPKFGPFTTSGRIKPG